MINEVVNVRQNNVLVHQYVRYRKK